MKGLVLAGGTGSRLRPITYTSAKQLVPVANRPILFYGLQQLKEAGIVDVGIVVGDTHAEIEAAVGDGSALGVHPTFVHQLAPRGLADAVLTAEEYINGDDFVLFLGDNLIEGGLGRLVEGFARDRPTAQVLLKEVADPASFGVAELDGVGNIARLVEKPSRPRSNLALVGAYIFTPAIFEAARQIKPSWRGELEITDAIQQLIDDGEPVAASTHEGWWLDTGKKDDLLEANRVLLNDLRANVLGSVDDRSEVVGAVVVEDGACVRSSVVRGPAVIGAGTTIEDAYVGPFTSIGDDCLVRGTEVEFSVLMDRCTVSGVERLEGSLLGRDVVVGPRAKRPAGVRLTVGDHSIVEL